VRVSIRTKFLLVILGCFLSLGIITTILGYFTLSYHFRKEFKKWVGPFAKELGKEIRPALLAGDKTAVEKILLKYLQREPEFAYFVIVDKSGNIFAHAFKCSVRFKLEEIKSQRPYTIKDLHIKGKLIFNYAYPLKEWTLHLGALRLTQLPVQVRVHHILKLVAGVMGLVSLLGIGLAYLLSHFISRPILTLSLAAKAIGQGNLDTKVEIKTRDEIGELANVFNQMTEKIKSTQEEIERLFNELNQIYNGVPTPIRVVDAKFKVISQNKAMSKLVGVSTEKAIGEKCYKLFRCSYCRTKDCTLHLVLEGRQKVAREEVRITPDGREIPCQCFGTPFKDSKGKVIGIIEIFVDITERKKFIQELEKKTKDLHLTLTTQRAYTDILTSLSQIIELQPLLEDVLTKVAHHTKSQLGVIYLHKDGQLKPMAAYALDKKKVPVLKLGEGLPGQCAQERETIVVSDVPSDYFKVTSGSGERLPQYIVCLPIMFKDQLIGVLELAAFSPFSEQLFQFLNIVADSIGVGIDHALSYQRVEILAKELQEKNELLISQNEELKAQGEELIALNEELKAQAEELSAQKKALEEKTRQVEEANRLKSEFLSNMSHELRTPLNAILGMTKLLKAGVGGKITEKQRDYLDIIERNGENLLALINDVLDLSKIEAGKVEIIWNKIFLKEFINELLKSVRPLAEEKGLILKSIFKGKVDYIVTDPEKLRQILLNLLSNAIKFTEKGEVAVIIEEKDGNILISVKDTGIGIPEEALDYIFDVFRQVDGSTTKKYGGTGLGLSIVKKLVDLLGGEIKVKSKLNKGSVFTVILPKRPIKREKLSKDWKGKIKTALLSKEKVSKPVPSSMRTKKQILIIDDDPIVTQELKVLLKDENCELSFAYTGEKGLEFIKKFRPDLLILDLRMPGMDGFTVLELLQKDEKMKDIPVIILSAIDLTEEEKRRFPPNVKAILLKGQIDKTSLIKVVRQILYPETEIKTESLQKPLQPSLDTTSAGPAKILIVEDNPDNLFLLKEALKDTNYTIHTAPNGVQAIEQAQRIKPDLIIMDMLMPIMDGYEATQRLKKDPTLKNIPIIGLTARAMRGDREKVLAAGCDDYLAKPVDPFIFKKKIEEWLTKKKRR